MNRVMGVVGASIVLLSAFLSQTARADDLFGGMYAHAFLEAHGRESDSFDTNVGYRTNPIKLLSLIWSPEIHGMISINNRYSTDFAAIGLDWPIHFTKHIYIRPGIGLAYTTGKADPPAVNAPGLTPTEIADRTHIYETRINFGDHVLFEPELAFGYDINEKWAIEATYVHLSNGQILHQGTNEGVDDIGLRLNYHFH